MNETIKRLIYLREELDLIIDGRISNVILSGEKLDEQALRECLMCHIDINLKDLKQGG